MREEVEIMDLITRIRSGHAANERERILAFFESKPTGHHYSAQEVAQESGISVSRARGILLYFETLRIVRVSPTNWPYTYCLEAGWEDRYPSRR